MFSFLVPQVYAVDEPGDGGVLSPCTPGEGGINLADCLVLGEGKGTVADTYDTPAVLINLIVRNLFVIAGIILFIMIIFAGFKFIGGASKGQEEAKNILTIATAGFLIMFAAYWIVKIVGIVIGQNIIF